MTDESKSTFFILVGMVLFVLGAMLMAHDRDRAEIAATNCCCCQK